MTTPSDPSHISLSIIISMYTFTFTFISLSWFLYLYLILKRLMILLYAIPSNDKWVQATRASPIFSQDFANTVRFYNHVVA